MTPWDDVQRALGRIEASQEHLLERIQSLEAKIEVLYSRGRKTRNRILTGGGLMGTGAISMEILSRMLFG